LGVIFPDQTSWISMFTKSFLQIIPQKQFHRTKGELSVITKIDTPISLGRAARTARKHLGLTQPQLALASGVGVRFIVELEAGKPTLRLENVLRVLHALGGILCVDGLEKGQED
jgi:HTH-type transcriptional regulator/antitoxin HipB